MRTATQAGNGRAKPTPTAKAAPTATRIEIPALDLTRIKIRILGVTPLIMHNWSEKARAMIRDKQGHKATTAKGARDTIAEAHDATYFLDEKKKRYAFPVSAFYSACSDAALAVGAKKSETRRAYSIERDCELPAVGPCVELFSDSGDPIIREDWGRIGNGLTTTLIYRPQFTEWHIILRVVFDQRQISASQIVNLFSTAGFCSGIGEWRPSAPRKRGDFGRFEVEMA